jgi:homoserine O-acetyltransferase
MIEYFKTQGDFELENGDIIRNLVVAYHSFGVRSHLRPVVWVCHALTANSDVSDWWSGVFGQGKLLDSDKYFIVCANNMGSCYGTTFELTSPNLPLISTRDIANMHLLLMQHLRIDTIYMLMGGSQGGQIALEIAHQKSDSVDNLVLLATNARHSPWGIAFNEAQRMCMEASPTDGIKAARAIAMLSYRNYAMYQRTEQQNDYEKLTDYGSARYQRHQAEKLEARFDTDSYLMLSRAMDSHNLGRGRGTLEQVLQQIRIRTLVIGISSDLLFPVEELQFLAHHLPDALLTVMDSAYGHDGFLTESIKINKIISSFLPSNKPHS